MMTLTALTRLATQARGHLAGPEQAHWLGELEAAHGDILDALRRCVNEGDARGGIRLVTALGPYWWMCGHAHEGQCWLEKLLSVEHSNDALEAEVNETLGAIDYALADYPGAEVAFMVAGAVYQQRGDTRRLASCKNQQGMVAREQGRYEPAVAFHRTALGLYFTLADEDGIAACQSNLGVVCFRTGDLDDAWQYHTKALKRREAAGNQRGIASSLGNLANILRLQGALTQAMEWHAEAHGIRLRLGDRWGVAGSLLCLGLVAMTRGDFVRAAERLNDAEHHFAEVHDALGACECLDAWALLAAREGHRDRARHLLQRAEEARDALGAPLAPVARAEFAQLGIS